MTAVSRAMYFLGPAFIILWLAPICRSQPSGMDLDDIPQMISITIDDYYNTEFAVYADEVFHQRNNRNPNGAPVPYTFFVSTDGTDYHLIQQSYALGNEIGLHTMTHNTGMDTTEPRWRDEIVGERDALAELSRIPREDLVGFRAPFLSANNEMFKVISEQELLYDASLFFYTANRTFPYRHTQVGPTFCEPTVGVRCPTTDWPNIWEVPVSPISDDVTGYSVLFDPKADYRTLLRMFQSTYNRHRLTKAPLTMNFHGVWFRNEDNRRAMIDFITWATQQPDTWFVTCRQLIEWMRDPHPIQDMHLFEPAFYTSPPQGTAEIADGFDNDGNGLIDDGFVRFCDYGSSDRAFNTTADACPVEYPTILQEISKSAGNFKKIFLITYFSIKALIVLFILKG